MLNYAYAVLFSQVKIQLLANGYDPTIGLGHAAKKYREALVLDHMEPFRPVIDGEILDILFGEKLSPNDFSISREGICRLNPQFAKVIAQHTEVAFRNSKNENFVANSFNTQMYPQT